MPFLNSNLYELFKYYDKDILMNLGSRENVERELEKINNNPNDLINKRYKCTCIFI